ncbi:MAG TPA: VTT domain-containing protein [Solirubrobacterales bacterium]
MADETQELPEAPATVPAAAPEPPRERSGVPWLEIGLTLAGVLLLAGLVAGIPALRHAAVAAVHGETSEVRSQIKSLGAGGPLIIVGLSIIHSIVPYPAEIVNAAAGFAYGFFGGLGIVVVGWMLSALICYWFGAGVARPLLARWFGEERFSHYERMVERGGITLLIALRLLPIVPFSLISYAAGAARVPFHRYCWTTAVGFLPITALAVYLGTRLEGISATDPAVIGALLAAVALILVANWIIKRSGATDDDAPDEAP